MLSPFSIRVRDRRGGGSAAGLEEAEAIAEPRRARRFAICGINSVFVF
jgi:hypothetical protein